MSNTPLFTTYFDDGGRLSAWIKNRKLKAPFVIASGPRTHQTSLYVELERFGVTARAESSGLRYLGETPEIMLERLKRPTWLAAIEHMDQSELSYEFPASALRNLVDCLKWDLEAKAYGAPVWQIMDELEPEPITTAFTISLDTPERMLRAARAAATRPLLKVKLGNPDGLESARIKAVREGAPDAILVADANGGWNEDETRKLAPVLANCGYELLEQPCPKGEDDWLTGYAPPLPLCADESCATFDDLAYATDRYQMINIKLDKAGGLTHAMELKASAQALDMGIFVGCMLGSSLTVAPAFMLAQDADYVDLDGPLWLSRDEDNDPPIKVEGSELIPPPPQLWG